MDNNKVFEIISSIIKENLPKDSEFKEVSITDTLDKLGFDSLSFINMIIEIESAFGFEINEDDLYFSRFNDVESLVDYVIKSKETEKINKLKT